MKNKLGFQFCGLFISIFMFGCATDTSTRLRDYKPKSAAEAEIKKCLMDYELAFNRHDLEGVLALIHDQAQLQDSLRGAMVSKKEYISTLGWFFSHSSRRWYSFPTLTVKDEQADVKTRFRYLWIDPNNGAENWGSNQETLSMVREGGKWLILKREIS